MESVPIFLNELSYPFEQMEDHELQVEVLRLLKTLLRLKEIARPIIIGAQLKIHDVPLTSSHRTLASLANVVDIEWWRFLRNLDQNSPFEAVPRCIPPDDVEHVLPPYLNAQAPMWANKNNSFLLSFPSRQEWLDNQANFTACNCADGNHVAYEMVCRNISTEEHVDFWRSNVLDFNLSEASSTIVYTCASFRLRLYLKDHEPPHVHVFGPGGEDDCLGRVRFDYVEVMEGDKLTGSMRREVLPFVQEKRDQLLRGWEKCRGGMLPNEIS